AGCLPGGVGPGHLQRRADGRAEPERGPADRGRGPPVDVVGDRRPARADAAGPVRGVRTAMRANLTRCCWGPALLACLAGCPKKEDDRLPGKGEVAAAKAAFVALQEALKAKDADRVWELLDDDSQADAERQARAIREAYQKAKPDRQAEMAKQL